MQKPPLLHRSSGTLSIEKTDDLLEAIRVSKANADEELARAQSVIAEHREPLHSQDQMKSLQRNRRPNGTVQAIADN